MDQRLAKLDETLKGGKDMGGNGRVVFTVCGAQYRVRADVTTCNFKRALALVNIIKAFETSKERVSVTRERGNK